MERFQLEATQILRDPVAKTTTSGSVVPHSTDDICRGTLDVTTAIKERTLPPNRTLVTMGIKTTWTRWWNNVTTKFWLG